MGPTIQSSTIGRCLFTLALCFAFFGTVMVFSASAFLDENSSFSFFFRQCAWVLLGMVVLWVASRADYSHLLRWKWVWVAIALVLLVSVLWSPFRVCTKRGLVCRWIAFGPLKIQPSEISKYAIIIFLAGIFGKRQEQVRRLFRGVVPPIAVVGVLVGLIFLEPDRSMSVFVALSAFVLWILSGARKIHFSPAALFGVVLFFLLVKDSSTAQRRWKAYLEQDDCRSDAGFQVCQSKIGLANGGVLGQGPGRGRQKLGFLPEPHTDFIFSVVGEELGFVGCAATLFGFAAYVWLGFSVARRATDLQATLLAAGITFVVGLQALINMSVATGVIPPTGIALPFISYGGSSMVSSMGATGILVNIARSIR